VKVVALRGLNLGDPWTYRFFPFELGCFLLGALAYRHRHLLDRLVPERMGKYYVYPLVFCFAAIGIPLPLSTSQIIYPIVLACVLPYVFRVTSRFKTDRIIGDLSYPFYIFHIFALKLAEIAAHHTQRITVGSIAWIGLSVTLVLSAIALALEVRFIEPWRGRFSARTQESIEARQASQT
jgi:peptidoglycan/LPS O-acetylase OafA/YrhL